MIERSEPSSPIDLLIAGTGFVGSYIAAASAAAGLKAHLMDREPTSLPRTLGSPSTVESCDLTDADQIRAAMQQTQPRVLVITAQLPPDGDHRALRNLVAAAGEVSVEHAVIISSLAVYGAAPIAEGGLTESTPPLDPSPYGQLKLAEEVAFRDAAGLAGVAPLVFRSTGVFGRLSAPRSTSRAAGSIDRVLRDHASGRSPLLTVEEGPDQYLYALELGHVVARAVIAPPPDDLMNVGPGAITTADELQAAISRVLNSRVPMETIAPTGRSIEALNVDRLHKWFPERTDQRADLESGLRSTMKDFARD